MKRILSVLLAMMLALGCLTAALAEDEVTFDVADITAEVPKMEQIEVSPRDTSAYSASTSDVVSIDGNVYNVNTGALQYTLTLDPNLGMICLTQDIVASVSEYWMLTDDMEGMMNALVEDGIHLFLYNSYTGMELQIMTDAADAVSEQIGTLSEASETMQTAYLYVLQQWFSADSAELVSIGGNTWVCMNGFFYVTCVGGEYTYAICLTEGDMTEDDVTDITDLLAGLEIAAV